MDNVYGVDKAGALIDYAMYSIIHHTDETSAFANAIKYLIKRGLAYVIMVKGHPEGYTRMVWEHEAGIKMNAEHLIPHTYLFGYQEPVQLFKSFAHEDYLTLFFDYQNGSERITTLLKNLYKEMDQMEEKLRKGEVPAIDSRYKRFLYIKEEDLDDRSVGHVCINTEELQAALDEKGLYGIVTSSTMTPEEVHGLYTFRSASETQYMLIKSELGYGKIRVQYTSGVRAKFTVGFIAFIIRYEMECSAKAMGQNVNRIIQELEKIEAQKINNIYTQKQNVSKHFSEIWE